MNPREKFPTCANCGTYQWPDEEYCPECGQKKYTGPPGFYQLIGAFLTSIFDLDNRFFRTLRDLLVPGRLTTYFLAGKQQPYIHPLRLFFVSGLLMVGAYTLLTTSAIGDSMEESLEENRESAYGTVYQRKLREAVDSLRISFPDTSILVVTDSLQRLLNSDFGDSLTIVFLEYQGGLTFESKPIKISRQDFYLHSPRQIMDDYGIEGKVNRYEFTQVIRLSRIGNQGIAALMGQLIWGLILLVPLTALLLKLVYIRRGRRYVEHFIFSLHVHAFLFLFQFLSALELYFLGTPYLVILSGFVTTVYFILALKWIYRQGWWKTLIKAFVLFWGYLTLISIVISVTILVAAMFF